MKKILFVFSLFVPLFIFATNQNVYAQPTGNYLQFFGGYVKAGSSFTNSPSAFSFEAWINPSQTDGVRDLFSVGDQKLGKLNYEVGINGGTLSVSYSYGNGGFVSISGGHIQQGQWNHVAVTVAPGVTKLFVNGAPVFTPSLANSGLFPIGPDITVGNGSTGAAPFIGSVDEVRVSDLARDVSSLWSSGVYGQALGADGNTVLLWHLDEARGTSTAHDSSGNGINGTLVGGDSAIHFFGILPTPTPFTFSFPGIVWQRPVLPTLSMPSIPGFGPTATPAPTSSVPSPTAPSITDFHTNLRPTRASFR